MLTILLCLIPRFEGIGGAGMAASEAFVEVRHYRWSDGSTSTERSDGCANLVCLIFFASFVGVGFIPIFSAFSPFHSLNLEKTLFLYCIN